MSETKTYDHSANTQMRKWLEGVRRYAHKNGYTIDFSPTAAHEALYGTHTQETPIVLDQIKTAAFNDELEKMATSVKSLKRLIGTKAGIGSGSKNIQALKEYVHERPGVNAVTEPFYGNDLRDYLSGKGRSNAGREAIDRLVGEGKIR